MVHPILAEAGYSLAPKSAADTVTLGAFVLASVKDVGGYIAAHALGYAGYIHVHGRLEARRRAKGGDDFNVPD